jgi:hypothetical protein
VSATQKLVRLERERTRRLSRQIEQDLRRTHATGGRMLAVEADRVEDVPRWRRAAVMAAHRMGHRATTYCWGNQVRVELDLPITEAERRRAAIVTAGLLGLQGTGR